MNATERWLVGISLALAATLFMRHEFEINKLRQRYHSLMSHLPNIILRWIKFEKGGKVPEDEP